MTNLQDQSDKNVQGTPHESQSVQRKKPLKSVDKENDPPADDDEILCLRSDTSYILTQRIPKQSMVPIRQRISRAVKSEILEKLNFSSVV